MAGPVNTVLTGDDNAALLVMPGNFVPTAATLIFSDGFDLP